MKTGIKITGQISSTSTLIGAISGGEIETKPLQFNNNIILVFKSKKDAVKALSNGYQYLHSDLEDWKVSLASYSRGIGMSYDAASASLINMND